MASQAFLINVIGAILLVVGILLHIVCMATPHMAGLDLEPVYQALTRFMKMTSRRVNYERNPFASLQNMETTYGPWKVCVTVSSHHSTCQQWTDPTDWIKATQAFSLLGALAGIAALIISVISILLLSRGNWKKILPILVCVAAVVAGVLVFIEDIIIAAKYDSLINSFIPVAQQNANTHISEAIDDSTYLDWGFGLDIVAAILLIVAGLVHMLSGRAAQREGVV